MKGVFHAMVIMFYGQIFIRVRLCRCDSKVQTVNLFPKIFMDSEKAGKLRWSNTHVSTFSFGKKDFPNSTIDQNFSQH